MNRSKVYGRPQQKKNTKPLMFLVLILFLVGQGLAQENSDKVSEQIELLKSPDAIVRIRAADALGEMGAEAVPALIEALKDQNVFVRNSAASALGNMGAEARQAIPNLIEALKDQVPSVRRSVASALGNMGAEARQAIPNLIEALKDPDADVRRSAANALGNMRAEARQAIPALIEALKDQEEDVRSRTASALGNMGAEARQAIPALIEALKDKDADVRNSVASALWKMGAEARQAIPALIVALKDQEEDVRSSAAFALGNMGAEAVPALIEALKDQEASVRSSAASALGNMGAEARQAIPALIEALKDQEEDVRRRATEALGEMGAEARQAIPNLIEALKDKDAIVRSSAAVALGEMGTKASQAIPALIETLKDKDAIVRSSVADALGNMGVEARQAIPNLIEALKDQVPSVRSRVASALWKMGAEAVPALIEALKTQDAIVRSSAANALGKMETEASQAIPNLIEALKDQEASVRSSAADALGNMGAEARQAIPNLIEALKDQEASVRSSAAVALSKIARALFNTNTIEALPQLKEAHKALLEGPEFQDQAFTVKQTIAYYESLWWAGLTEKIKQWFENHSIVGSIIFVYLFLIIFWWFTFWLRPLWLLSVSIFLSRYEPKFKTQNLEVSIPLRFVLLISLFHYRNRILDKWVGKYLETARENFTNLPSVLQRKISVSLPVSINGKTSDLLIPTFQSLFDKSKVTILIAGEGGAGKTTLACQMATWAMETKEQLRLGKTHSMLPVLIENNLESVTEGKEIFALTEAIHGHLCDLIGMTEPIFDELFIQLLRKRRVLVIIDSLSELNEKTRASVTPTNKDFPIAALVVTSRIEEKLGGATKAIIKPLRLKSTGLSAFFHDYLSQCGKRDQFEDEEFFEGCRRLSQIVDDREITVLIAKMFAEQMIASKEQISDRNLPRNLPDLMQGYIKILNEQIKDDKIDTLTVLHITRLIAVKCLKQTYRPVPVKTSEVVRVINADKNATDILKNTDAMALLKYLEKRLQIIQTTGVIGDEIRFSLDPLAEYLTGLYLVESYGGREERWKNFIKEAQNQPGAPEAIKGLLLAVRDCCVEKGSNYKVPEQVKNELGKLAGLHPSIVNASQLSQRINRYIANLKLPDAADRVFAAEMLMRIGHEAKAVVPEQIEALKEQDGNVRSNSANAFGEIMPQLKKAVLALNEALKDQDEKVRDSASNALAMMGAEAVPVLLEALKDEDARTRGRAAMALGNVGREAKQATPALSEALKDQDSNVRSKAGYALRRLGVAIEEDITVPIETVND